MVSGGSGRGAGGRGVAMRLNAHWLGFFFGRGTDAGRGGPAAARGAPGDASIRPAGPDIASGRGPSRDVTAPAPRAAGARFQGEAPGGLPHLILLLVALALGVDHLLVDAVVDVQALVDLLEGAVNLRLELPLVAHGASVGASLARAPPPSDASWRANSHQTRHSCGRIGMKRVRHSVMIR